MKNTANEWDQILALVKGIDAKVSNLTKGGAR